jgi:hypothetical protein
MCDFSLHAVRSRPAKVGDRLPTRMFNAGTTGFCAPEDEGMAVCLLPGTELSFDDQVRRANNWPWNGLIRYKTAIFRQINKDKRCTHHDALEFPNGQLVLLTLLMAGQQGLSLLEGRPSSRSGQPSSPTMRTCVRFVTSGLGAPPCWRTTSNASARLMQASRPVKATEDLSAEPSNSTEVMCLPRLTGTAHFWLALFLAERRACVLGPSLAGSIFSPASFFLSRSISAFS